ncbi:tetratricopeptide repeat protein [Salinimicrobium oceani]|uniref:Tetratricopeptide repeat protein n=1 Tax=Salinimicrobium oceani TaxID=2722702 RepID=A0ABX1D0M7_9FLAO|nr:tetratricopeptide repeat protein [Salinimicrobium oceani]NJW53189.1 tetratricopeptide repeat protein [Salinimicrobium oceani]
MKTRILTAVLAMFTVVSFAQKKEIKRAGKAVEKGEYQEAKSYLNQAEAQLANADEDEKADFYLYKGYALVGNGENVASADLMQAAEAMKKAKELGHEEAQEGMATVSNALVNSAIADQNTEKYAEAATKLETSYRLNTQDTIYLYYAASNAVNGQDYDAALKYYNELRDLGFTGEEVMYTAVNKETGEEERMASKEQRDLFVKAGTYINPQEKKSESRKGEIAKNIALIYIEKGENEKAIAAMESAKQENPGDASLMQAEADMYYKMGDMKKYRETIEKVLEQNPDDATLYYNLGVSSAELGENDRAIEYYKKAIELDPSMKNARLNIAFVILSKEEPIVKEMNSLGMSKADQKKYDELAKSRQGLYRDALPHLEKVLENDPSNIEAARTIMNIHYQLNQTEEAEAMKAKIDQMQAEGTPANGQ